MHVIQLWDCGRFPMAFIQIEKRVGVWGLRHCHMQTETGSSGVEGIRKVFF